MVLLRFCVMLAVLIALSVPAQAQGYDGLIAPDKPATPAGGGKTAPKAKPQSGYQGLIADPGAPSGSATVTDALVSKSATLPGTPTYRPAENSEQLKTQAAHNGYRFDPLKHLDAETREKITVLREGAIKNYKPARRVDGLLAKENSVRLTVETVLNRINDPKLTPEQRQMFGEQGYDQLLSLNDGLLSASTISDEVYKSMGMPDLYVTEQREANKNSLKRVRDALAVLKPYQTGAKP